MIEESIADQLRRLKQRGILTTMTDDQLKELRCALDEDGRCYCPYGPTVFDPKTHPPTNWAPSMDHFPEPEAEGGHRTPDNARLAHIRCNDLDYKWRQLPEGKRQAAVERWRKRYLSQTSTDG